MGWQLMPGSAKDVAVGADGTVWVVGTDRQRGGFGIWRFNGYSWDGVPGGAVRIAGSPDGTAWIVNEFKEIWHLTSPYQLMPGEANDIGIGADGTVWVVGTDRQTGGFGLWQWTGKYWANEPGGGADISVAPNGKPWIRNAWSDIYHVPAMAALPPPKNLHAVDIGSNFINLAWTDERDDESGFVFDSGAFIPPHQGRGTVHKGFGPLRPDTTYCFRVSYRKFDHADGFTPHYCVKTAPEAPPPQAQPAHPKPETGITSVSCKRVSTYFPNYEGEQTNPLQLKRKRAIITKVTNQAGYKARIEHIDDEDPNTTDPVSVELDNGASTDKFNDRLAQGKWAMHTEYRDRYDFLPDYAAINVEWRERT